MNLILRNYSHGSKIILSICSQGEKKFVRKGSYCKEGIADLERECAGFAWYLAQVRRQWDVERIFIKDSYLELRIPLFDAEGPVRKSISRENRQFFVRAIDHYNDVWTSNSNSGDMVAVHGDYSLDGNILFSGNNIFVIDWEHFSNSAAPKGFDILYLIFEAVKIYSGSKLPNKNVLELAKGLIEYAQSIGAISEIFDKDILGRFLEEQSNIGAIWGDQKGKLPTTQFNSSQLDFMIPYFVLAP